MLRPDIGLQAQFKKKKEPVIYRYDRSLDPQLSWDINADREQAEALLQEARSQNSEVRKQLAALKAIKPDGLPKAEAVSLKETIAGLESALAGNQAALEQLKRMSSPFLNWAGKAERNSFSVPTLPLFTHERLSTEAILKSVQTHKQQLDLFGDARLDLAERVLRAYEHKTGWVNRLILGDSLVVMNSLVKYEALGGQVQCIYVDPPYGVKFGSNFQPFIRKRDVKHNDDEDLTREPEMVQAYRDTWELGLHSYLTYLRDRFLLCRELLHPSGSLFVQISDENLHHVREVLDEVFGAENFCCGIKFFKTTSQTSKLLPQTMDYLLWYARDKERVKWRASFVEKDLLAAMEVGYDWIEERDGTRRPLKVEDRAAIKDLLAKGCRVCALDNLISQSGGPTTQFEYEFQGQKFRPASGGWKTNLEGMKNLEKAGRLEVKGNRLRYVRYFDDFRVTPLSDTWTDTSIGGFVSADKLYVVQTSTKVVQRCILMTTDPGDLVVDPTCGSGTTAYVAEQWGRRWITMDTSRVPLALARQRLLTATFPYWQLRDEKAGVSGGFKYERKQNKKGEDVGGIVPHVTLKSIANNEPPEEEVLVDRPNELKHIVRVSGPFVVEATIPTPVDFEADGVEDSRAKSPQEFQNHIERMLEALRRSPVLRLPGNQTVTFKNVRQPAKTLSLHAEAEIVTKTIEDLAEEAAKQKSLEMKAGPLAAFVFGPENGAVSEQLVFQAAKEAHGKSYRQLYVIGFAIQDSATKLIQNCEAAMGIPATYVAATMDLQMHDLLKTTRASQIFSVTGAPEIKLTKLAKKSRDGDELYQVELLGMDVFDPVTMENTHRSGGDVPAWLLDTDYSELAFCVTQAFFPRTAAWDNLKRELKGQYADSVWEHLAGTTSEPFAAGERKQIAVKVIDDRGNELLVVRKLSEVEGER